MRFTPAFLSVVLGSVIAAIPAVAQDDLAVDEVLSIWQKQKEVFHKAQSSELGRTRGLELITIDDPAAATADEGVSVTAGNAPTDPNRPLTNDPEQAQPVVFGQLAPELQVNLQIRFAFDSAALADDQKTKLNKVCQAMGQSDVQLFRIVGHTDAAGPADYNEKLSALRAEEVARHLVEDCGIARSRLETMGVGRRFLFNTQNPLADENRRVEFQALS
jgi:OmpA-OmpF porin, OOP family